ncbi:hypothetical protein [Desulforhopalus sp. 52FAK]
MNIDKYMKKAYGFFAKTSKEQRIKAGKLDEILAKLIVAQKKLTKEIAKSNNPEKKETKQQELAIVTSLVKKVEKRLKKLKKK